MTEDFASLYNKLLQSSLSGTIPPPQVSTSAKETNKYTASITVIMFLAAAGLLSGMLTLYVRARRQKNDSNSSSSSPQTPASDGSDILTPRRKVQALLGQFSDSEADISSPTKSRHDLRIPNVRHEYVQEVVEDNESEEDEVLPRGKLAARLLGGNSSAGAATVETRGQNSVERSVESTGIEGAPVSKSSVQLVPREPSANSSEDDLVAGVPKRSILQRVRRSVTPSATPPPQSTRADSPLFFSPGSSPGGGASSPAPSVRPATSTLSTQSGKSKFLALVEKHRKERIAREAAEVAKKALRPDLKKPQASKKRTQRGSSPADDSEESGSSEGGATTRISKQARPTRKASKKALEEMNRETQRMSRNMQLAHQARTKTKITKESLLARFNLLPVTESEGSAVVSRPADNSSATVSDAESGKSNSTPPTSPLRGPDHNSVLKETQTHEDLFEMHGALVSGDELPDLDQLIKNDTLQAGRVKINAYVQNDRTVFSPQSERLSTHHHAVADTQPQILLAQPTRTSRLHQFKPLAADSDSGSDIEIVMDKGLRRKYAAFETLPKRKAKEMPSHLALRSLAHIVANEDKKRSMNAAELDASLRRTARLQAIEERRQRIEELRAKGHVIQTAEERERDQQEVEDLVERARQEAADIQKREKELAKKDGTYVKDGLDDEDDDSDDEDFDLDRGEQDEASGSDEEGSGADEENGRLERHAAIDDEVEEAETEKEEELTEIEDQDSGLGEPDEGVPIVAVSRRGRGARILSDDEDEQDNPTEDKENQSPPLPAPAKTPQSITRSARKTIPGLQMSDDLPMGLSQAFAATMAESQSQNQDSFDLTTDLPSPKFMPIAPLQRMDSIDMITDSQPASQTQPLNVILASAQSQTIPESPARGLGISAHQFTPSQRPFELTQDEGYMLSPFAGSRFADTPVRNGPQSTVDTVVLPSVAEDSPVRQRRNRLVRRRASVEGGSEAQQESVFQVMQRAAKKAAQPVFDKSKSEARRHFDEAAEESEDEYAGLGGASDEDIDDEENEEDRQMIDEDTQVGEGDKAKLAALYADRERVQDERDVSKLLKDITTGALRRKRGVGDDLDLSDEEDAAARRREAKRREFARMRRELLKDEAVGKIAEDRKKEAFLRSIEDREPADEDDVDDFDRPETQQDDSQSQSVTRDAESSATGIEEDSQTGQERKRPFDLATNTVNRQPSAPRRTHLNINRKPLNLAEIRESVSFLIEESESQAGMIDLGLSDSEDEPEAYVDLDRHLRDAENDENAQDDDADDLGGFIVNDEINNKGDSQDNLFKKPEMPAKERAPFSERRTPRAVVVDRLSLLRQSSSSSNGSNLSTKMAFFSAKTSNGSLAGVPSLLRRATTNSSLGSMSGRETVSATGVTTSNGPVRTERGSAGEEKDFIRKGSNGRRNAVNYQARTTLKEEKMSQRAGIAKASTKKGGGNGFLGGLFRGDSWE